MIKLILEKNRFFENNKVIYEDNCHFFKRKHCNGPKHKNFGNFLQKK